MIFEEMTEDILNEKLITYGNRKSYGQIVFVAGGAGSGKGFAISNFLDSTSFKVRDVDEMKKQLQILNRLGKLDINSIIKKYGKNIKPKDIDLINKIQDDGFKLQNLNLKNPDHVYALHILVKAMGIKDKSLTSLLTGKDNPETLPNILFDITAKDVTDITSVIPKLKAVGYKPENIHLTWVLTNYVTAMVNNRNRERMVPDDILLKTHEGASTTIWGLVTKALPKGMNGRVDVILNNPNNTVFYKDAEGRTIKGMVKGFLALPLKKEKGGIYGEKFWKDRLFKWVKDNAPESITANMKESIIREVNESVASAIDLIRQDAKDVRDFVKKVFSDSNFKDMKNDKDFVQYLKSIYEGVVETVEEAQSPAQKAAFQKMLDKKAGKDESKEEEVEESVVNEINTSVNKRRAGAELKQKLKGKRSDGMGKYTATIYGMDSAGKRVELKSLNDLNKYSKFELDESVNEGLKHNDMYTMLDIAAGYSSTQDQAANQMWSDEQDLYDYLKSDHIPKKYHKKFHNDIKRRFKDIKESVVNEASKEAMGIAALTGTRGSAVEDFILKHKLDGKKLFKSITKANLRGRLNFASALAGKDGNPNQKLTIKLHKNEVVNEAKEPEVITQLRKIVKDKQNALVVDTKSKKKVRVDMQSANVMVQVYDALKQQSNKDKFVKGGIVSMGHMAYKLMKNEDVNEGDGLWANIRAKKARGEKPAHKNSTAHKDAVKAGEKIKKKD